jgi:hypothetical protein
VQFGVLTEDTNKDKERYIRPDLGIVFLSYSMQESVSHRPISHIDDAAEVNIMIGVFMLDFAMPL